MLNKLGVEISTLIARGCADSFLHLLEQSDPHGDGNGRLISPVFDQHVSLLPYHDTEGANLLRLSNLLSPCLDWMRYGHHDHHVTDVDHGTAANLEVYSSSRKQSYCVWVLVEMPLDCFSRLNASVSGPSVELASCWR